MRGVENRLYLAAGIGALVVVVTGFAQSYFLKTWFGAPALSGLVHLHGALMSAWFALFLVQVRLVASQRTRLHRRLGVLGAVLAALIVFVGIVTVVRASARELGRPDGEAFFSVILALDLYILLGFGALVAAAVAWRRRPDVHKRLMLLASLSLLAPAISRLPFPFGTLTGWAIFAACLLLPALVDSLWHRRVHPVFACGVPIIVGSQMLVFFLAQSEAWTALARRLVT